MKQVTKDTAPAAPSTGSGICKHCGGVYNRKEIIRIYGEFSPVLAEGFCSSSCYTKSHYDTAPATAPIDNKDDDFIELDVPIKTPLWEDDKPDNKDALQDSFTGGDWRVEKSNGKFPSFSIVVGEVGEASTICTLFTATMDLKEDQEANAALIAQAKNMYKLLKQFVAVGECAYRGTNSKVKDIFDQEFKMLQEILLKANPKQ